MRHRITIGITLGIVGLTLLVAAATTLHAAPATIASLNADPHWNAWRDALVAQDERSQVVRKAGGVSTVCGTDDELQELARHTHEARMRLLESLQRRGIDPTPPPPGFAPWPWSAAAGTPTRIADLDSMNTAVVADDGRIVFTNLRGAPEVDGFIAAQAFYARYEDEYDFLMLFTSFPSDLFGGQFRAFHLGVSNDIEGLGYRNTTQGEFFDEREAYTKRQEQGALQSFVHLNWLDRYPDDPHANYWRSYTSVAFMAHEIGHRWAARLGLWLPLRGVGPELLGRGNVHWSFFLNSSASVMEGNQWIDEIVQLRTLDVTRGYGPLDLYLMGMLHPTEVPVDELWYVDNVEDCDPPLDLIGNNRSRVSPPQAGVVCVADRVSYTMENVFLGNGLRRPVYPATQRQFRIATVLVVPSNAGPRPGDLEKIDRFREALKTFFSEQTQGRGSLDMQLQRVPGRVLFQHRPQGNVEDAQAPITIRTQVALQQRSLPTTLDDLTLELFYSVDGAAFVPLGMQRGAGDEFTATIPAQPTGTSIRYYMRAAPAAPGYEFLWPDGAPGNTFAFSVRPDDRAPSIEHVRRTRLSRQVEPPLFRALVRDDHAVNDVRLEYRLAGGALQSQPMPAQGVTDIYETRLDVPGRVGDIVEYRIVARDAASTPHVAAAPSSGFYEIELTLPQFENAEVEDLLWTHRSLRVDGPDQWHREPFNHTPGGFWSWKCGPNNVSTSPRAGQIALLQDAVLMTPAMRLFADWELSFWHRYYFRLAPPDADDSAVDGAIVEWQDVEVLDDVVNDKWYLIDPMSGYPEQFGAYAYFNDLGGYPCWSAELDVWTQEFFNPSVTFHEFAGRLIRFRFRVATSAPLFLTTPRAGWYIDDIVFDPGTPLTPVTLEAFDAERVDAGVRVTWRARDVESGDAFRLYRARVRGGATETFERVGEIDATTAHAEYEFVDEDAESSQAYAYRLGLVSRGVETPTNEIHVGAAAARFHLARNVPNPFNPSTAIRFELPRAGHARLVIYDVQGRRVRSLVDEARVAGAHRISWDGTDDAGRAVASGVYLYRLISAEHTATHRMMLVR